MKIIATRIVNNLTVMHDIGQAVSPRQAYLMPETLRYMSQGYQIQVLDEMDADALVSEIRIANSICCLATVAVMAGRSVSLTL